MISKTAAIAALHEDSTYMSGHLNGLRVLQGDSGASVGFSHSLHTATRLRSGRDKSHHPLPAKRALFCACVVGTLQIQD